MIRKLFVTSLLSVPIALVATAAFGQDLKPGADLGQAQLVSAIDAAWVRVVRDGTLADILTDPANASTVNEEGVGGVLPVERFLDHADCLPNPDVTHYPGEVGADTSNPTPQPTGLLLRVLNTASINRCFVTGNPVFGDTTDFARASEHLQDAIFAEMAAHYCTEGFPTCSGIAIVDSKELFPPSFDGTTALNVGDCDFIEQVNALGGRTFNTSLPDVNPFDPRIGNNERRRDARLFSCMISGSEQFIHIPKKNRGNKVGSVSMKTLKRIKSLFDLQANPDVVIVSGNLSTQLVNEYMPDHTVVTVTERDIEVGWEGVFEDGVCNCRATFAQQPCEIEVGLNAGGQCPDRVLPFPPFTNLGTTHVFPDVIINPNADLNPGLEERRHDKLRVVRMNVTAGTPLWVGIKDVP